MSEAIHKVRVLPNGWHLEMVIQYCEGLGDYKATYFYGNEPFSWRYARCPELAAHILDVRMDKEFGTGDYHYVQIGNRVPVGIQGINEAAAFAEMWGGVLITRMPVAA